MTKITVTVRDFDPTKDKFITRKKLAELSFINSPRLPSQVNDKGRLKTWVGIGWVDEEERPGPDVVRVLD